MTQTPCRPPPGGCWAPDSRIGGRLGVTRYGSAYEELLDQPRYGRPRAGEARGGGLLRLAKGSATGRYKGCSDYADYRELLRKEKDLDAVYVATPDHWHAPIALAAMRKHKHVLGQKPMAHSIADARRMAQMAREMKVATSLTVNNPSSEPTKLLSEWIADGAIGRSARFTIGRAARFGHRASTGRKKRNPCLKVWTGIFGSDRRPSAHTTTPICRLCGVVGTISVAAHLAIWAVTVLPACSKFWAHTANVGGGKLQRILR